MDSETLYHQVGRLIEAAPSFAGFAPLSPEHLKWLGRVSALVDEGGDPTTKVEADYALTHIQGPSRHESAKKIMLVLYKVLGRAELRAPPSVQGSFIPAGNAFDAFAAVTKVLQAATTDVFIVDPYMDETILSEFAGGVPQGVLLRLMTDRANLNPSLAPAATKWTAQYGAARALEVRSAPARALHDRAIFIDKQIAWLLTQSLKDFAKRSPAEIVRADDTAALKIAAYETMWTTATVIV